MLFDKLLTQSGSVMILYKEDKADSWLYVDQIYTNLITILYPYHG